MIIKTKNANIWQIERMKGKKKNGKSHQRNFHKFTVSLLAFRKTRQETR